MAAKRSRPKITMADVTKCKSCVAYTAARNRVPTLCAGCASGEAPWTKGRPPSVTQALAEHAVRVEAKAVEADKAAARAEKRKAVAA